MLFRRGKAWALSPISGKCRRSSMMAASSPLSFRAWRMASAVGSSMENIGRVCPCGWPVARICLLDAASGFGGFRLRPQSPSDAVACASVILLFD